MEGSESFRLGFHTLLNIGSFSFEEWAVIIGLVIGMFILLITSAFISASEIAFFSIDAIKIAKIKEEDAAKASGLKKLLDYPDKLLATILIVNNTVNIALILISTIVVDKFANAIDAPGWIFVFIQVVFITTLILLFGEIIPKVYATQNTIKLAKLMLKPMTVCVKAFSVASFGLVRLSNVFDKKIKIEKKSLSVDELSEVHEIVQHKSSKQELKMLDGILEIGQTEVKQIMKNRTDITAISVEDSFIEIRGLVLQCGFSRIPVYEGNIDKVKGILYVKDMLPFLMEDKGESPDWQSLIRPPFFVPESKKLDDLLSEFREKKIHLALVVDEYGGTSGVVTLEDIIEEIVGDIKDEFDDDDLEYSVLGDGKYILDGKIPLLDMYRILEVEGEDFEELKGESETVAGLLLEVKGGFPAKGETITINNYEFTVEALDKKRIQRVKLEVKE